MHMHTMGHVNPSPRGDPDMRRRADNDVALAKHVNIEQWEWSPKLGCA